MAAQRLRLGLLFGIVVAAAAMLTSCGGKGDQVAVVGVTTGTGSDTATGTATSTSTGTDDQDVGPQYTQPSMDTLKGVRQRFPAKYPVKRYPHAQVVLAWVYPNLKPGWKNQVMLRSYDETFKISHFYKKDLLDDGWTLVDVYENPIYSSTRWRKNGQEIEVRVSPDQFNRQNIQLFSGPQALPKKMSEPPKINQQ